MDDSEDHLFQDIELLKRELDGASPGRESALMRLLAARVAMNSAFQFWGLLDVHGTNWESNHASVHGAGVARSQVHGAPFWDCRWWQRSPEAKDGLKEAVRRAARGEFVRYDVEILGGNEGEELITIDFNLNPVRDRQGKVVFLIAEGRDVTEQRRLEREVARHRDELATLDRLKTEFVANVSHEFRTPLTLILGHVEDALCQPAQALAGEGLAAVHRSTLRLLRLVNTLLDFSRIEAGRLPTSFEPTDLARLTAELASSFRSLVEGAGLAFVVDCPPLPEPVYVDRAQWEKIVLNLLSNAFKFTFQGQITASLRLRDASVELSVSDTGTGIPADELPRIVERFHRVPGARGRSIEGTGIGLALVQELVRMHGGSLRVSSEVDRGSTFVVSIPRGRAHLPPDHIAPPGEHTPLQADEATAASAGAEISALRRLPHTPACRLDDGRTGPPDARAGAPPGRILVADDNADMRDYLVHLLGRRWRVEAVPDGHAALASARARPPDLLVSDVMMPGLDGVALLRELRADPRTCMVPVVLVSARAGEEAVVEGLETGADDYLVKPFSARELLARVQTQLEMARMRRAAAEAAERERAQEVLRFLDAASVALADSLDHRATLARVAQLVVPALADVCLVDLNEDEEGLALRRVEVACADPAQAALAEAAKRFAPGVLGGPGHPSASALIERGPVLLDPLTEEHLRALAQDEEHLRGLRALGGRALLWVPLARRGRLLGMFTFLAARPGRYGDAELSTAQELARRCALAADNALLYRDAQRAIALRDEFLSIASHELKTPLTPLGLQIQTLLRRAPELAVDAERRAWLTARLELIRRQGDRLKRLVDNLLDLSRLSAGRLVLDLEPVRLSEVVRQVVSRFEESGEVAGSGSSVGVRVEGDAAGRWDRMRLDQVVDNLLANALKYGQGKPIEIAVASTVEAATLTVADHGIGIAPEHVGRIFGRFERAVSARHYGGLGMGLYISRQVVDALDGAIEVSSVPGEGSTFTVTLPLAGPAATRDGASAPHVEPPRQAHPDRR
ncbi:ATP-binding protein [Sorangium cellulosum]|uniref:ATP-binding protein n=1 Tax=Sorangium cellulosum TaxID=56 RepID=UPI00133174D3|nr:ATP-binding protein [Sorangium cellulosum]